MIPSSKAMATAVSLWSPVIITGLMPARLHSSIAAFTSGRTGSIIPASPMKTRFFSSSEGSKLVGSCVKGLYAPHITLKALLAMRLFSSRIFALNESSSSTIFPSESILEHRFNTSSGAPLVYCSSSPFSSFLQIVDIIFRIESKGASPTRL